MKTVPKNYPRVINIVGAGNVGVWTAYRLCKLYEAHGLAIPEIHLFDKNPEAAMRLYTNTLNALAHINAGLNAATTIVKNTECYELHTADLSVSCALIKQINS